MLNDIECAVLTWLLSRGAAMPAKLFVYRTDALGQPTGRAEMIVLAATDGVSIHDGDAIGNPVPRPRLKVLRSGEGWSLFAVDPLGRTYQIRDLTWRQGQEGLELVEADARGGAEARPLQVQLTHNDRAALYTIDLAGGRPTFPQSEIREDKARGWFLLHDVGSAGQVTPRPSRVLAPRN